MALAEKRLAEAVTEPVREVCRRLSEAGYEAYAVGGAVRDALLGRTPGDWDVATSARPDEVQGLFRRTIPTGVEHGTVTVLVGRGRQHTQVEVTTYRGEGAYSDARRPDHVVFGVPLEEDLARRDFVVNAIAFDPITGVVEDPFGGREDLARRRLRAVGDPAERFREDGLRVLRAVRFVSTLEFDLDPATEEAIGEALDSLAKVAMERVRVELYKLLESRAPERGLEIAWRRGILDVILPELSGIDFGAALARVKAAPADPPLRIGALLEELADPKAAEQAMRRLTLSNADRQRVVRIVRFARALRGDPDDAALRRFLGEVGREGVLDLIAVWRASGDPARARLAERSRAILEAGDPLSPGELALGGEEIMRLLGIGPGRRVGVLLRALLERVFSEPTLNTREKLEPLVKELDRELD